MYSLYVLANISRSRCITRAVWTKWHGLVADNVAHAAGASILSLVRAVFAGMRSACGVRRALDLADFHNVAIAMHPVHGLQIRPIVHN